MLGILEGAPRQTASSAGPDGYQETVTESTTRARDDEVAQEQDQYSTEPGGEALSSISGALTKVWMSAMGLSSLTNLYCVSYGRLSLLYGQAHSVASDGWIQWSFHCGKLRQNSGRLQ